MQSSMNAGIACRLLNIIALVGTNYSCLYFLITAANKGITPGIFTRYLSPRCSSNPSISCHFLQL